MSTFWLIAKYIPDRRRNEPRNVGVLLCNDGETAARFVGQDESGKIDGRKIRWARSPNNYRAWVHRWEHDLEQVASDDAFVCMISRPPVSNYFIEYGGTVLAGSFGDTKTTLDRIFAETCS